MLIFDMDKFMSNFEKQSLAAGYFINTKNRQAYLQTINC